VFQYVISVVARADTPGSLEHFVVVPSRELTDFYGVKDLPMAFRFDGQAAALPAPELVGPEAEVAEGGGSPDEAAEPSEPCETTREEGN
jgi:hypothetical protein